MFCAALLIAAPAVARADACDKIKDAEAFNACLAGEGPAARAVEADVRSERRAPARAPQNPETSGRRLSRRSARATRPSPDASVHPTQVKTVGRGRMRLEIIPQEPVQKD